MSGVGEMRRTFSAKENPEHPETRKKNVKLIHAQKERTSNKYPYVFVLFNLPVYFQVLRGVPVCSGVLEHTDHKLVSMQSIINAY